MPGVLDTLRLNGRAIVTTESAFLEQCAVDGKLPLSAIIVEIEKLFLHCAKLVVRSGPWKPERWPAKGLVPSTGTMVKDRINLSDGIGDIDAFIDNATATTLY